MNPMSTIESTVVSITERPGVQDSGTSEKPDDNKEKHTNTQTIGQVSQTY